MMEEPASVTKLLRLIGKGSGNQAEINISLELHSHTLRHRSFFNLNLSRLFDRCFVRRVSCAHIAAQYAGSYLEPFKLASMHIVAAATLAINHSK
jgi:hypothetical protein